MRRALLGTSIATAVLAVAYLGEAMRYPRGTMAQPGPGLFPLAVGALLLLASLATGLEAWPRHRGETCEEQERSHR